MRSEKSEKSTKSKSLVEFNPSVTPADRRGTIVLMEIQAVIINCVQWELFITIYNHRLTESVISKKCSERVLA